MALAGCTGVESKSNGGGHGVTDVLITRFN